MYQLLAQNIRNPVLGDLGDMTGVQFFGKLIPALVSLLIVVGVVIFLFILIWGAIQWMTSGGDKGANESARSRIANALIGITILLGFLGIVSLVEYFFGIGFRRVYVGPFNIGLGPPPIPPDGNTPTPGGNTPTPGTNTPTPGGSTPTPTIVVPTPVSCDYSFVNSASGKSCSQRCSELGCGCSFILLGGSAEYWTKSGTSCSISYGNCATIMTDNNIVCDGYEANWTFCQCN